MIDTAAIAALSRDGFWIEWDMGDYGPFATEAEARAHQRAHRMTGSTVVNNGSWS